MKTRPGIVALALLLSAAGAWGGDSFDEVEETNTFLGARYGSSLKDARGLTAVSRSQDGRYVQARGAEVPARIRELLAGAPGRIVLLYHFIDGVLFDVSIGLVGKGVPDAVDEVVRDAALWDGKVIERLAMQLFGPRKVSFNGTNSTYDDLGPNENDAHILGPRFVVMLHRDHLHVRNRSLGLPQEIRSQLERARARRAKNP